MLNNTVGYLSRNLNFVEKKIPKNNLLHNIGLRRNGRLSLIFATFCVKCWRSNCMISIADDWKFKGRNPGVIYRQFLFKDRLPLMNKALDAYSLRQRTISKNIANVTSPHYRPEEVKFEEFFHEAEVSATGERTDEMHIPIGKKGVNDVEAERADAAVPEPEVYFSGETHVNIDKEMSKLAQNQIRFRFGSLMVKGYFTGMTSAITGQSRY